MTTEPLDASHRSERDCVSRQLRKRGRDDRKTDFADTEELSKNRAKRVRPDVAVDGQLSIADGEHDYVKTLEVTVDYVLNDPKGQKPNLNALTATDAELADRLKRYCHKDDMSLLKKYRDTLHYIPLREWKGKPLKNLVLVSLPLGEVLSLKYKLLGSVHPEKEKMNILLDGKLVPRAQIIMAVSGEPKPDDGQEYTADHKCPRFPLNDSFSDLKWSTASEQIKNQRKAESIKSTAQTIHLYANGNPLRTFHGQYQAADVLNTDQSTVHKRIKNKTVFEHDGQQCTLVVDDPQPPLPYLTYPELMKGDNPRFQCARTGQYRTLHGNGRSWGPWRFVDSRAEIELDNETSRKLSIVLYECFSGDKVNSDEYVVDHIDRNPRNNSKENLRKITQQLNMQRKEVKMIVRLESNGNKTLYASRQRAAAANRVDASNISACLSGRRKLAKKYGWRDASVDEIRHFFETM